MNNVIKMEITRSGEVLSSVKLIMPTWQKVGDNKLIYIDLPFFGLNTCAKDEADIEIALKEAVSCFCIAAERYGLGLESELEFVGWEKDTSEKDNQHSFMNLIPNNTAFDFMINTGETQALELILT